MKQILQVLALVSLLVSCAPRYEPEITPEEIREHIAYLASDALGGRYPGTPEDALVSSYITGEYRKAGLRLYKRTGIQPFPIITEIEAGPGNRVQYGEEVLEPGTEFMPFPFSANATVAAELVFAGYGIRTGQEVHPRDDYAGMDVSGKWVMVFRGVPGDQEASSTFFNFSEDRGKALLASDLDAAGVVLVSGSRFDPEDRLVELNTREHSLSIPVIHITRNAADKILAAAGADSISVLDAQLGSAEFTNSFATGLLLEATVDLHPRKMETANTIAVLNGSDPVLNNEYVVIGAHHDHLGMGGAGTSSRMPDTLAVHYGADDNASGVAGVIEISENLASRAPSRSILFTTFGAEEMGAVGSRYLVEHFPVDLDHVQAMINLDMVGRLNEDRQLQVGGIGTSPGFRHLVDSLNAGYGFNLKYSSEGYGPSDHASFYARDVPVLFFTTGGHPDYHTPSDRVEAINLKGEAEVLTFVADVAEALANQREPVAFTEAGPKVKGSSRGHRGGVTLGLMPDVTYDGNEGMPFLFLREGGPAAVGGMQQGDTIVAIEGKSVGNVYDYMSRMEQLKEGMDIVVTVKREGETLDLVVRL
jgi:aminopeptidase YwaD